MSKRLIGYRLCGSPLIPLISGIPYATTPHFKTECTSLMSCIYIYHLPQVLIKLSIDSQLWNFAIPVFYVRKRPLLCGVDHQLAAIEIT